MNKAEDDFLYEIFNSKFPVKWQHHGNFELCAFVWNNEQYIIQISPASTLKNSLNAKEVSFFLNKSGNDAFKKSIKSSAIVPSAVYGIVLNTLTDKLSISHPFYFTAEYFHNHSKEQFDATVKMYEVLARRVSRNTNGYFYKRVNRPNEFLISLIEISDIEWSDERKKSLKEFLLTNPFNI